MEVPSLSTFNLEDGGSKFLQKNMINNLRITITVMISFHNTLSRNYRTSISPQK
jgi:hypothetical protein